MGQPLTSDEGQKYILVFLIPFIVFCLLITGVFYLFRYTDINNYNPKSFDDHPGEILAGYPATVESVLFQRQTDSGIRFYLVTEDCDNNRTPKDNQCPLYKHRANAKFFYNARKGDVFRWDDAPDDQISMVVRREWRDRMYREDQYFYDVALLVEQCRFLTECVTDTVEVSTRVWINARIGDEITFGGEKDEVVS